MRRIAVLVVFLLVGCSQQSAVPVPAGPPTNNDHSPRAITLRVVERILAQAPLPSGSRTATAREANGKQVQAEPADPNLVDRHATYVVPLGFRQAIGWFRDHPPARLTLGENSTLRGRDGPIAAGLGFMGRSTLAYDALAEKVAIYPLDTAHAVVRVDALAVWRPQPSSEERVPMKATAVHVLRVARTGAKPQRFTLTGPAVHRLARELNKQRPINKGPISCPADYGGYDELHFTGATPDPVFRVEASGCRFITVTANGVRQPTLGGGAAVDKMLAAILAHHR